MSEPVISTVAKLQDRQIIKIIEEVKNQFGRRNLSATYGSSNIPEEELSEFSDKDTSLISSASIVTENQKFNIRFERGKTHIDTNRRYDFSTRIPTSYTDEIIVTPAHSGQTGTKPPSTEEIIALNSIISSNTTSFDTGVATEDANPVLEILQTEIAALAASHRSMLEDVQKTKQNLENDYISKKREIEDTEKVALARIRSESENEEKRINKIKSELEAAKKELDDRDHMHVRRELREKINAEIHERLSESLLPKSIGKTNWVIFLTSIAVAALAAIIAFYSFNTLNLLIVELKNNPQDTTYQWMIIVVAIRGTVGSLATLGFLIYAISWLRKTYLDNAKASHDLQRYALDINRASWTIETIMEMTTKEGRVLPDKWIEGVCHGLFQSSETSSREVTPVEAWTALLGVSGKVEYGPNGPRLEFNKKQSEKLSGKN